MAEIAALTSEAGIALGAGLAMGLSALAAAWSQGSLGSAAMGVAAERPEFESKMLIYIVLPEILALLGFAIAFLLALKVGAAPA
jgi:F0F1-type ATP synthase membrane subunit c/vacuolar-type H+-ATPase subunit K